MRQPPNRVLTIQLLSGQARVSNQARARRANGVVPGRSCVALAILFQDRVVLGIHHFITSSGQKAKGNVRGALSTMVNVEGRFATCSAALTAGTCLGLFGAFRRVKAASFFFL